MGEGGLKKKEFENHPCKGSFPMPPELRAVVCTNCSGPDKFRLEVKKK